MHMPKRPVILLILAAVCVAIAVIVLPTAPETGSEGTVAIGTSKPEIIRPVRKKQITSAETRPQAPCARDETNAAVERALKWLSDAQDKDGAWSDGRDGDYNTGVGALAVLAFMQAGYNPDNGAYRSTLSRGIDFLVSQADSDGRIGCTDSGSWIYNHAIALLALSRACADNGKPKYRETAKKAAEYLIEVQNPGWAWKYSPKGGQSDTSVTCWSALALFEANASEVVEVPRQVFLDTRMWLDKVTASNGRTGYMTPGDSGSVIPDVNKNYHKYSSCTASAIVIRLLTGQKKKSRTIRQGVRLLLKNPPVWFKDEKERVDYYYAFWAANAAARAMPVDKRKEWASHLASSIIAVQEETGDNAGSFPPIGKWSTVGGRVYSTAMCALTLLAVRDTEGLSLSVEAHRVPRPEGFAIPHDISISDKKPEDVAPIKIDAPTEAEKAEIDKVLNILKTRKLLLNFGDASLAEVSSFLQDLASINIVITPKASAYEDDNRITLRLRDMILADVFEVICISHGKLDYGVGPGGIVYFTARGETENLAKPDMSSDISVTEDFSGLKARLPGNNYPFGLNDKEYKKCRTIENALKKEITVEKMSLTFFELKSFIEDKANVSITFYDADAEQAAAACSDEIKVKAGKYSFDRLLWHVKYLISPEGVSLVTRAVYYDIYQYARSREIEWKLGSRLASLRLDEATIHEAYAFLEDVLNINIIISAAAGGESTITLHCKEKRPAEIFDEICRRAGLAWEIRNFYILIKTPAE
jgi:hypothetical protein